MNSHERRVVDRYWRHVVNVDVSILFDEDGWTWLHETFGSCTFKRKNYPRWCWRPHYVSVGNFAMRSDGAQIFFRKKADYAWFMLKWDR